MLDLNENGIDLEIEGDVVHKSVSVRLFMLDSPARADFCKIKGHGSWQGCPICKFTERVAGQKQPKANNDNESSQNDETVKKKRDKVVYSNTIGPIQRTDETYKERLHPEHHKPEYINKRSALEIMGFKMISQFPLDPMHVIDLGVVLKVLKLLIKMKNAPGHVIDIDQISERIIGFKNFRPSDFARDIRSLEYVERFKATELRQFLLYGSIVFLKDLVDDYLYEHWLLLHVAVRLLASDSLTSDNIDTAEVLLKKFVEEFPSIYGKDSVSYVVHVLMHIPYYSRIYGPLDQFSCYKYENAIQRLKSYIGNAHRTLQQICNRIEEEELYNSNAHTSPEFNTTEISCSDKDSFVAFMVDGKVQPFQVLNIYEKETIKFFTARRCLNLKNLYTSPMNSSDIGEVTYESFDTRIEHFETSDVVYKYCRIPYQNVFVLIPILHSSFRTFNK